ncbi:MAG: dehydrogenase [Alphaproteobacteria bacterium]|nr:dehydrogenase [Alphaproteobacteria bacterium]
MMDSIQEGKLTFFSQVFDKGLRKAITMSSEEIIEEITKSGLKGRGGAGFPTGLKWKLCGEAESDARYIVCNADEGEPGTFKDRLVLAEYADFLFEGMTIAARAIDAFHGFLYLRAEYTYLRKHLEDVLRRRRDSGLLGNNILGVDGYNFDIEIHMGSGAYICGEETALIQSLEGFRGEPRNRPPYPVVAGYEGKPTSVNNVETLAWAPCILTRGADWFQSIGTEHSSGLKLFSVSGDVERPGIYELPMGTTVAELMKVVGGENAKAVQVGGASGRCVPASKFDQQMAYEAVSTGGSIIAFGPDRDMLEVAENFMEFFAEESCGQCTPCRNGNAKILEGVRMLREGKCSEEYLNELLALCNTMQVASKCGLGQASTSSFVSIIESFWDEIFANKSESGCCRSSSCCAETV